MAVHIHIPDEILLAWEERNTPIVKYPDPVLRQIAEPVGKPDRAIRQLVDRMKEAMISANGIGLAAPQLGVSVRVIVYRLPDKDDSIRILINPRILTKKGDQIGTEGCLSIPLLEGQVNRANEIMVKGIDILGRPIKRRASEMEARVIQHEVDHLDGIMFFDKAQPETLGWLVEEKPEYGSEAALTD